MTRQPGHLCGSKIENFHGSIGNWRTGSTRVGFSNMAKVQQKSEKISAFGGIFFVLDKFDRILSSGDHGGRFY